MATLLARGGIALFALVLASSAGTNGLAAAARPMPGPLQDPAAPLPLAVAEAPTAPTLAERLAALEERLERARIEHHIPGMAIAIVADDRVVLARGFGSRDLEQDLPADAETLFAIGSTTKAFTSLLVAMMVDEGRMSWDDPVRAHLPTFRLSDPEADAQATLRDLLCHRTGLARTDLLWANGQASSDQIYAALATAELKDPFRRAFNYNNIGFLAAGDAAANAAGVPWTTLVQGRILDRLGMFATVTSIEEMQRRPNASKGYVWDEERHSFRNLPMRSIASCAPAGAINSNVLDMSRWLRLQLGRGSFEGQRLVSEENLRETWTRAIDIAPGVGYGLGWMVHDWNGTPMIEHGGNIDGFAAEVAMLPERGAGFVLLTNVSATPLAAEAQHLVWEALFPTPGADEGVMSATELAPYAGKYRFDQLGVDVTVLVKDGKLCCDVPGQTVYELKWPDEEGKWAFALTDTVKVEFEKDAEGAVPSMTMHQAGLRFLLPRVNPDGSIVRADEDDRPFTLDQLRAYTGVYRFERAQQDWRVLLKDGRLAIDVPGQMVFELNWPDAQGRWSFAATDAVKVSFEKDAEGAVDQLICYQAGQVMPMPRTGPGDGGELPSVDDLMALRASQGDRAAVAELGVIRIAGSMRFVQQGIDATVESTTDQQGRFALLIDAGVFGTIRMACDGTTAWTEVRGGPVEEITGARVSEIRRAATNMFVRDLREDYDAVEVVRRDTLDGQPVIVVRGRSANGKRSSIEFVDPATGLVLKEESITTAPGVGRVPSSARYAGYRDFEGLTIPTEIVLDSIGSGKATMTVQSVTTRVEAGPGTFVIRPTTE